jgi:hypothetical protein
MIFGNDRYLRPSGVGKCEFDPNEIWAYTGETCIDACL